MSSKLLMRCATCGKSYLVRAVVVGYGIGRYCSRACVNIDRFKGRKQSPEHVAKRTAALIGRRPSDLALVNAARWHHDNPDPRELTDRKTATRLARLNDPILGPARRERLASIRRGYHHPEATKAKIRASNRSLENRTAMSARSKAWHASLPPDKKAAYLSRMRKNSKPSSIENAVASILDALGVSYLREHPIPPYVADFWIPARRLVIECDGTYWHGSAKAIERDRKRDEFMRGLGYLVLRLPEAHIRSGASAELLSESFAEAV